MRRRHRRRRGRLRCFGRREGHADTVHAGRREAARNVVRARLFGERPEELEQLWGGGGGGGATALPRGGGGASRCPRPVSPSPSQGTPLFAGRPPAARRLTAA